MNEVFYAPVEIESADQLESLNITWKDVRTWHIGNRPVRVYLVPADQETSEYLTAQLRTKYSQDYRASRCMVPGVRKPLIRCPDENKCSACPYGRHAADGTFSALSLDDLLEEGYDQPGCDDTEHQVTASLQLEKILARLHEEDPRLVQIIELKAAGYSVEEISARVGLSTQAVYRSLKKIQRIAEPFRE